MSKIIVCPACGNRGEASTSEEAAFAVRGHFSGKPIRKCNKCGDGLALRWLGKPKLIPKPLWERMEESWNNAFKEDEDNL